MKQSILYLRVAPLFGSFTFVLLVVFSCSQERLLAQVGVPSSSSSSSSSSRSSVSSSSSQAGVSSSSSFSSSSSSEDCGCNCGGADPSICPLMQSTPVAQMEIAIGDSSSSSSSSRTSSSSNSSVSSSSSSAQNRCNCPTINGLAEISLVPRAGAVPGPDGWSEEDLCIVSKYEDPSKDVMVCGNGEPVSLYPDNMLPCGVGTGRDCPPEPIAKAAGDNGVVAGLLGQDFDSLAYQFCELDDAPVEFTGDSYLPAQNLVGRSGDKLDSVAYAKPPIPNCGKSLAWLKKQLKRLYETCDQPVPPPTTPAEFDEILAATRKEAKAMGMPCADELKRSGASPMGGIVFESPDGKCKIRVDGPHKIVGEPHQVTLHGHIQIGAGKSCPRKRVYKDRSGKIVVEKE